MTSDQQKQQQQMYITRWVKLFGRIQNLLTASLHHYTFHLDIFLSS